MTWNVSMASQKTFGKWQAGGEWGTRKALDKKEAHETVPNVKKPSLVSST